MHSEDYKILFTRLAEKVKQLRALQKKREQLRSYFPLQDKQRLWRLQREVDNMLLLDMEGQNVFIKNNA